MITTQPRSTVDAEAFSRLLEGTSDHQSWTEPELRNLPEMLALTEALRSIPTPEPRAEFIDSLRTMLIEAEVDTHNADNANTAPEASVSAAAIVDLTGARRRRASRRAFTAAAAGSMVLCTAGIAAAAQNSLPGSELYPVKRATESVQLAFATSDSTRGQGLLDQARTRLREVHGLAAANTATSLGLVQQTLRAFTASANEGANLLLGDFQRSGNQSDLKSIRSFTQDATEGLGSMAPSVVHRNRALLLEASSLVASVAQQSKLLCPTCAALPPLNETFNHLATAGKNSGFGSLLAARLIPPTAPAQPVPAARAPTVPAAPTNPPSTTPPNEKPTDDSTAPVTSPVPKNTTVTKVTQDVQRTLTSVLQTTGKSTQGVTTTVNDLLGSLNPQKK